MSKRHKESCLILSSQDNVSKFYKQTAQIGCDENLTKKCLVDDSQRIHRYDNAIIAKKIKNTCFFDQINWMRVQSMQFCNKIRL